MKYIMMTCIMMALAFVGVMSLAAQEETEAVFAINYAVTRVFESAFGYGVVYRTSNFRDEELLVPTRWIYKDKIALVGFSRSTSAPFLQVYYNSNQEVSFFRLILPRSPLHSTWEYEVDEGLEERFANATLENL